MRRQCARRQPPRPTIVGPSSFLGSFGVLGGRPPSMGGTHPPLERSNLAVRSVWFAVTGVSCDDSLVISETPGVERRSGGRGLPSREKKYRSGRYAFRTRLHRGAGGSYPMRTSRRNRFAGSRKQVRQRHRGVALLARGQHLPAQDIPSTARSMMVGCFFPGAGGFLPIRPRCGRVCD